jgi:hypothetical protein
MGFLVRAVAGVVLAAALSGCVIAPAPYYYHPYHYGYYYR